MAEGHPQRLLASIISSRPWLSPAIPVIPYGELIQIGVELFFDHFIHIPSNWWSKAFQRNPPEKALAGM